MIARFFNELGRVVLISFFIIAAVFALLAVVSLGAEILMWSAYAGMFYVYILIVLSVTIIRMTSGNTN